jgi:hypothetical protein
MGCVSRECRGTGGRAGFHPEITGKQIAFELSQFVLPCKLYVVLKIYGIFLAKSTIL